MSTHITDRNGPALLSFVRHETRFPAPKWFIGLDLGQRHDHSAIAVLELSWLPRGQCKVNYSWLFEPQLVLRGLERVPLGMSYEDVHIIIAEKLKALELRITRETGRLAPARELIIDAGGPGPPMVDRLRRTLGREIRISPVIITGGKGESRLANGYTGIPRRSIITRLLQMISRQTLRCPGQLAYWDAFVEEFLELSGASSQPGGQQSHDDLVLSTGLAAWIAVRDVPELKPGESGPTNGPLF